MGHYRSIVNCSPPSTEASYSIFSDEDINLNPRWQEWNSKRNRGAKGDVPYRSLDPLKAADLNDASLGFCKDAYMLFYE